MNPPFVHQPWSNYFHTLTQQAKKPGILPFIYSIARS
jgi:hypothetical protein